MLGVHYMTCVPQSNANIVMFGVHYTTCVMHSNAKVVMLDAYCTSVMHICTCNLDA